MAPVSGKIADPVHYQLGLHGMLFHQGESAGSERYTVDAPDLKWR